jgi:hypothetical protein
MDLRQSKLHWSSDSRRDSIGQVFLLLALRDVRCCAEPFGAVLFDAGVVFVVLLVPLGFGVDAMSPTG